jgi:hypothetical protein
MKHTSIALDKLELWFKIAKPGDIAFHFEIDPERYWIYIYREDDTAPCWHVFNDVASAQKYLDSSMEPNMEKRCENCKHFKNIPGSFSWCSHKDHAGALVPVFTSCADHESKQKIEAPFDNLKFFIKDQKTGELEIKYIREDCCKIMEAPFHWQFRVPFGANKDPEKRPGYYYWCEECWEKEKKK